MSTAYRIGGRGHRLTEKILRRIAGEKGWRIKKKGNKNGDLLLTTSMGYIHIYKIGKTSYNAFERYGGNFAIEFIEGLEDYGYTIYSEHDDEFWR